jgi:hypothetical protein
MALKKKPCSPAAYILPTEFFQLENYFSYTNIDFGFPADFLK